MDFVDCLVHITLFFTVHDPGAVPFSCLSHTGPPDCSGPFLSHSCLSNTPPTTDMSSSNRDDPNTPGKECKAELPFLLFFLHRKSKSSCRASSFGPKVFLLNSFCAHTCDCVCVWVNEWMNEYARVCLTILAIKPCSIGLYVDFSGAAHPGQFQHRAWMPYPSFPIISSPFHALCSFIPAWASLHFSEAFQKISV